MKITESIQWDRNWFIKIELGKTKLKVKGK